MAVAVFETVAATSELHGDHTRGPHAANLRALG